MNDKKHTLSVFYAVLAAALYALSIPLSKILLSTVPSVMLASLLYLGAGIGMCAMLSIRHCVNRKSAEMPLTKKDLPFTLLMVLLDIAAPILLLFGLSKTTAANGSLLNNFEIVATAAIALLFFSERISKRLWLAIGLITAASILLTFDGADCFSFSEGSILVLLACVCWGVENNCTRVLSAKDPLQIVAVKGIFSGLGALLIALCMGERLPSARYILFATALGFFAYGLSIYFYIRAQRSLGAAKTSAYYALSPFIGTLFSFALFRDPPGNVFLIATALMLSGAYVAFVDPIRKNDLVIQ